MMPRSSIISLLIVGLAATAGLLSFRGAAAHPEYLVAWEEKYSSSTLPSRMAITTFASCDACHRPPDRGAAGTCYREDIKVFIQQGRTIEEALALTDGMDSDQDGFTNGEEILAPRWDLPGEIGYHPGLAGPLGEELCGFPPMPVTLVPETPCAADFNVDGRLDVLDFTAFQNGFALGKKRADVNTDGSLDILDFAAFQNLFALGCQ